MEVYPRARVVVNERTGTVVIGGTVRLQPVSILHGGLCSQRGLDSAGLAARTYFRPEQPKWSSRRLCRPRTSRWIELI